MCVLCGMPTNALIGKLSFLAHYLLLCGIFKGNVRIIACLRAEFAGSDSRKNASRVYRMYFYTHTHARKSTFTYIIILSISIIIVYIRIFWCLFCRFDNDDDDVVGVKLLGSHFNV